MILDPVIDHSPAYDPALTTSCLEGHGASWWDTAIEAQEGLWSIRCCNRHTPRWVKLLGRDLNHWVRQHAKTEAWSAGRGETWLETAQRLGVRT